MNNLKRLQKIFTMDIKLQKNFISFEENSVFENQKQTNEAFSKKWNTYEKTGEKEVFYQKQKEWYLTLYGFNTEDDLRKFLQTKKFIFDAGCGLGFKSAWFAKLAPNSIIIGMDFSESVLIASKNYKDYQNLFFIRGDIANIKIKRNSIDYVSCDQVIHHTENPEETFKELSDITKINGEFACYVYAKKAVPRELLDDYFREKCKYLSHDELMLFSKQMTDLGKQLSQLNIQIEVPDISILDIKAGKYDIQRFLYWNFMKCFWNEELGYDTSMMTNYDWYSPSNATRYSENEYRKIISANKLEIVYFHSEEACYSGRFKVIDRQMKQ